MNNPVLAAIGFCKRGTRVIRTRVLLIVALLTTVSSVIVWSLCSSASRQQLEQRLRTEVPIGASQDQIQAWTKLNGASAAWSASDGVGLKTLSQLAGVVYADVEDVVRVSLPGVSGLDGELRPYRTDVYILLDKDYKALGYYSHRYPERPLWHRLIP